jgi:sulfide:quinone oxidoreductase
MSSADVFPPHVEGVVHRHRVLIIGAGTAGVCVAARLRRAGVKDIAIVEPSPTHYYQPLWTLVGAGAAPREVSARPMKKVIPAGVRWFQDRAIEIDAEAKTVALESSGSIAYDFLVAAPGLQLDWDGIEGLPEALETPQVSSNYHYDLAPKTWQMLERFRGGTAIFTCPHMPIKCAGAPQKIAYLAADYFRQRGILETSKLILATATPTIFGVKEFADPLLKVIERYGIDARYSNVLSRIDPVAREATFETAADGEKKEVTLGYDLLHAVPPQSAPDFIKKSPLAGPQGWVDVDKHTLQHARFPNVFALGDATNTPNAKTAAAVRKQAPILVANLLSAMDQKELTAFYNGYGACPLTTSYRDIILAEFDYTGSPAPTFPAIDTLRERRDYGLFKRYALPALYWHGMLRGRA